jgi:hypothetical protein
MVNLIYCCNRKVCICYDGFCHFLLIYFSDYIVKKITRNYVQNCQIMHISILKLHIYESRTQEMKCKFLQAIGHKDKSHRALLTKNLKHIFHVVKWMEIKVLNSIYNMCGIVIIIYPMVGVP